MQTVSEYERQLVGCGFAPPLDVDLRSFADLAPPLGADTKPTVCPGYSTSLPEVIEVARARLHWSKGGPAALGIVEWHDDPLAIGIEVLEGAANECQSWTLDNPVKKGG